MITSSPPPRLRLVLADDHALVRAGIARLLQDQDDVELVGQAADGDELLALAAERRPDVVVTDLSMPGLHGLELVRAVAEACPAARVLVLTMHKDAALASHALAAGAAGYVSKAHGWPVLRLALDQLRRGTRFVDPDLAHELIGPRGRQAPHDTLSPREFEVLEMIAAGRPLKEIGYALRISPKTVTSHKRRLMNKLGVVSTAELIRYTVSATLAPV